MRSQGVLSGLLAACVLLGGCSATPGIPQDLTPSTPSSTATAAPVRVAAPVTVAIPSIGVNAKVEKIGLDSQDALDVTPLDAHVEDVGYYMNGPPPGAPGVSLLAAHINFNRKPGAFVHLAKVAVGDKIMVGRVDGTTATFTVTRTGVYPKTQFDSLGVYSPTPDPQLRLVSCGGILDVAHHNYLSNVIVWASLDVP